MDAVLLVGGHARHRPDNVDIFALIPSNFLLNFPFQTTGFASEANAVQTLVGGHARRRLDNVDLFAVQNLFIS